MFPLVADFWAQNQPSGLIQIVDRLARVPISKIVIFAVVLTLIRLVVYPILKRTPIHLRTGGYNVLRAINEIADALVYAAVVVFLLVRPFGIQTFFIPSPSMVDTLRTGDYILANKWVYRGSDPQFGDIVVFKPPVFARLPGNEEADFIKRCIGVPGDVIEIKDWQLYRNGKPVEEDYKTISNPATRWERPLPKEEWPAVIDPMPDFKLIHRAQYETDNPAEPGNPHGVIPLMYRADEYSGLAVNAWDPQFAIEIDKWQEAKDAPPVAIPNGYYLMVGDNRNGSNDGRFWGLVSRQSIIGRAEFVWLPIKRAKRIKNPFGN